MTARWVGLVVAGVVCAACGVGPEDAPRPLPAQDVPPGVLSGSTRSPQPPGEREQRLVFVRDAQLVPVRRPALQVTPQTVLADLLTGPLPVEREQGLTTALPSGVEPFAVTVQDAVASVDLGDRLADSGRDDPVTALAQVVLSLTALPEVDAVRFVQDGVPVEVPRGDGRLVDVPLGAQDYRALLDGA